MDEDRVNILNEMRAAGLEESVDGAVAVLVHSGMSTRDLRMADAQGIAVEAAGTFRFSFVVAGVGMWIHFIISLSSSNPAIAILLSFELFLLAGCSLHG